MSNSGSPYFEVSITYRLINVESSQRCFPEMSSAQLSKKSAAFFHLWICSSWDWCRGCELITRIVNDVTGFSSESNSTDEFCSFLRRWPSASDRVQHTLLTSHWCRAVLPQSLHNKPLPEMVMQVLFLSYIWHRCGTSYCSNYLYEWNLVKKWRKKITQEKKLGNIGPIFSK